MAVAVVGVDIVVRQSAGSTRGLGWVLLESFAAQAGCDAHSSGWLPRLGVAAHSAGLGERGLGRERQRRA